MAVARSCFGGVVICYVLPVYGWRHIRSQAKVARRRRPSESQCTRGLGLVCKLCAVIPIAGQRTHGTAFRALEVTSMVGNIGGGVCDLWLPCFKMVPDYRLCCWWGGNCRSMIAALAIVHGLSWSNRPRFCCVYHIARLFVCICSSSGSGPDLSVWRPWAGSLLEAPTHRQITVIYMHLQL